MRDREAGIEAEISSYSAVKKIIDGLIWQLGRKQKLVGRVR
jgi:hypothetical protein